MPRRQCNLSRWMKCRRCQYDMPIRLESGQFEYVVRCLQCGTVHLVDFASSETNQEKPGRMNRVRLAQDVSPQERVTYGLPADCPL